VFEIEIHSQSFEHGLPNWHFSTIHGHCETVHHRTYRHQLETRQFPVRVADEEQQKKRQGHKDPLPGQNL